MGPAELETYEVWLDCITKRCKIALTPEYVAARLTALRGPSAESTYFEKLYGRAHLDRIVGYFERAASAAAA